MTLKQILEPHNWDHPHGQDGMETMPKLRPTADHMLVSTGTKGFCNGVIFKYTEFGPDWFQYISTFMLQINKKQTGLFEILPDYVSMVCDRNVELLMLLHTESGAGHNVCCCHRHPIHRM